MRASEMRALSDESNKNLDGFEELIKNIHFAAKKGNYEYHALKRECNQACINKLKKNGYVVDETGVFICIKWGTDA